MRSMEAYPRAAMERAMKVQDVMLQAMAKKITWWQAAEILGISDRHMRRIRERYVEQGYNGLLDRRRGKPSRRRVPVATVEKVFGLYREKYFDLNVQHFHEKLQAEHGIELSYTWVKQALQGAGLVGGGRKRGAHRKRREQRTIAGDAVAYRRQPPPVVSGRTLVRPDRDSGRCHGRDLLRPDGGGGIDGDGDGGTEGSDRAQRGVLRAVQRSGKPFLADAEGGRQGGLPSPHAGGAWTCDACVFDGRTRSGVVPQSLQDAYKAEIIFLAVPFPAHKDVAKQFKRWNGKIIMGNLMNAFHVAPEELGGRLSSEVVSQALLGARLVKAVWAMGLSVIGRAELKSSSTNGSASLKPAANARKMGAGPLVPP